MKRSTDRVRTMHAGSLPRPDDVREMVAANAAGTLADDQPLRVRLAEAVEEVVRMQLDCGIDSINDGELSKTNFTNYANQRLGGIEVRTFAPGEGPEPKQISARDRLVFPEYFNSPRGFAVSRPRDRQLFCVGPITYVGADLVKADTERFRAALSDIGDAEPFLPAVAPGSIEHWLWNEYYPTNEEFLYAIADAMHEEYKAIADAGFILQIDDPDMFDAWQINTEHDVPAYRDSAQLHIDVLNHALRDIPREQIRLHVCWGSYHGPHQFDIGLEHVVDLFLSVKAQAYSIEAANPRHEHEWAVWKNVTLPEGAILIPGVVGHSSDFVEHPQLVAQRLLRYADIVGKENLMAGTDCGLGTRVGHAKICWAKFRSLSEGARIASEVTLGVAAQATPKPPARPIRTRTPSAERVR